MWKRRALSLVVCAISLVHVCGPTQARGEPHAVLTGVVRESVTGSPVPGARVQVGDRAALTDARGEFVLEGLRAGVLDVTVSAEGYGPETVHNVVVSTGRIGRIVVVLRRADAPASQLEAVRVQADVRPDRRAPTSTARLTRLEMQRAVGAAWDIQRIFAAHPGTTSSSDLTNNLVVRGGNPSENAILVDHVEVPNISHLAGQGETGGAIGMVNLDFVRDATFYTGGFAAQYGGRLSSVLDIRLREGNRQRVGGELELSLAGFGGGVEGPLAGDRGSWVASYRRSFLDRLREPLRLTAIPRYDDAHAKLVFDVAPSRRLSLVGIGGRSQVDIPWMRDFERVMMEGSKYLVGATWYEQVGAAAAARVTLAHVGGRTSTQAWQGALSERVYDNTSREGETSLEAVLDGGEDYDLAWQVGARARRVVFRHRVDSEAWHGFSENMGRVVFIAQHRLDARYEGWSLAGFAHGDLSISRRVSLRVGVRAQHFTLTEASSLDPRVSFSIALGPRTELNASAGAYHQSPTYVQLTLDERNLALEDAEARHAIVGLERRLGTGARLRLEAYRKDYAQLPVRQDERIAADNVFVNRGRKKVVGAEVLLEKRLKQGVYGLVSLSLSDVKARDGEGAWYDDDFDYGLIVTATGGFPVAYGWEISGKWRYVAGRPYTLFPIRPREGGGYELDPDYSQRNGLRYPAYHRLDLRLDRRLDFGGWGASFFVEVQNVYNRDNVFTWQFDPTEGVLRPVLQFQRLSILGLIADF